MRARNVLFVAALCAGLPTFAHAQDAKSAPLVVRWQSLDEQKSNFGYFAEMAGHEVVKVLVEFIAVPGIDGRKPFGVYAKVGAKRADCAVVGMVPVVSEKKFTDALGLFKIKLTKLDDGTFGVCAAPHRAFVRFADGYAYVSCAKAALAGDKLLDPKAIAVSEAAEVFAATLRPDLVPEPLKKEIVDWIVDTSKLAQQFRLPFESEKHRALRKEAIQLAADEHVMWIKDCREISHSVKLSRIAERITVETKLTAAPNSKLVGRFEALGKGPSLFGAMLSNDAIMSGVAHFQAPAEHRKFVGLVVDEMMAHAETHAKAWRKESDFAVLKSFAASMKSGEMDHGFAVRGPGDKGLYTFVGGAKVKDGLAIDKALQGRIKDIPEAQRKPFQMNAETAGAVKIHRVDLPPKLHKLLKHQAKTFGAGPLWFAFRDDAVFLATGENALAAMKEALAAKPKAAPASQFGMSFARLVAAHAKDHPRLAKAHKQVYDNDRNGGRIDFAVETGESVTMRLEIDTSLVKFLGKAIRGR